MRSIAADIAEELNQQIASLAPELLPHGFREGIWWRVGSLLGEPGQSLAVTLSGFKQGRWSDFASGEGGDALDLVAQIRCRGDKRQAIAWARAWLGHPERPEPPHQVVNVTASREHGRAVAEQMLAQNRDRALRIWLGADPVRPGDVVWRYLADRAIDLGRLPRIPSVLRTHPRLWNVESGRHWPAMVALITDPQGQNCAVHRTWLAPRDLACEDRPIVGKAPLRDAKRSYGSFRGGYIRLWRGAAGRSWSRIQPGETLLLAEGIEDLLSYLQFWPQWRAACAVSLSLMMAIELPAECQKICILAQRDRRLSTDGKVVELSPARRLFWQVVHRFEAEGRRVNYWTPPVFAKDINDYIRHPSVRGGGASHDRGAAD